MDRRLPARGRAHRLLLAGGLGLGVLGMTPWSVAADETPTPTPEATASSTPEPTPEPTAQSTPGPLPAPTVSSETSSQDEPTPTPTATSTPTATATQTPAPTATPTPPAPSYVVSSLNLYRSTAMVRQYTNYWCVPATVQSMTNLIRRTSNRTYSRQAYIYRLTRAHNRYRYATKGNDPQGWAWSMRYFSGRNYQVRSYSDKSAAISYIAASIARTRQPVGVPVFAGTHAWVVLGYKQSFDPSEPSKKTLLGLYVSGPLGTTRDRWPYKYLTVSQFRQAFTRYHEWQRRVIWEGKWVVIAQ